MYPGLREELAHIETHTPKAETLLNRLDQIRTQCSSKEGKKYKDLLANLYIQAQTPILSAILPKSKSI